MALGETFPFPVGFGNFDSLAEAVSLGVHWADLNHSEAEMLLRRATGLLA